MKNKITLLIAFLAITLGNAQNLAAGKTTASSFRVEDPVLPGPTSETHALAVDENGGTRWESQHTESEWWSVDLGASYDIGQIIIKWEGAYGKGYNIEISSDNATWSTIYTTTTGDGGTDDLSVTGTGRYLKFNGTERGLPPYGYSFFEFEVYEYVDATIDANLSDLTVNGTTVSSFSSSKTTYNIELPVGTSTVPTVVGTTKQSSPASAVTTNANSLPGTSTVLVTAQDGTTTKTYTLNFTVDKENLALNKTATASSSAGEGYQESYAFDGNTGTRWGTPSQGVLEEGNNGTPEWIYVDLEDTYSLTGVNLNWEGAYATDYLVQVSSNANDWTTVHTQVGGDGSIDDISFTETSGQYVRIYATKRGLGDYGYSLWEVEVYGTAGETLSFDNVQDSDFSVSPNPTTGLLNINSNTTIDYVQVYDISGRSLLNTTSNTVDLSNLNNGIYILKIETNGVVKTKKIIKK
ncbi:galactose-binding domain-containing protein [Wenyingzhuangia sp. IMCC45467]